MSGAGWLPVLTVLSSLVPGLAIFFLAESRFAARTALNLLGAVLKLTFVGVMVAGVYQGASYEVRLAVGPDLALVLHVTALPLLFLTLSALLWLLTTLYAIGYLESSPDRSRFFGFFSLCVSATTGVALAGNLFTFVLFYEALTLATWPLVAHRGTEESIRAGRIYLAYTLGGGALLLLGAVWLHRLVGAVEFAEGGVLHGIPGLDPGALVSIFALLVVGLGVKASLVPLHGWLPTAMVAPAPVSALLHAVAVVKAGAFGLIRVVYDIYGIHFAADLGVMAPLAGVAAITILWGSIRALYQTSLKRRLAYSTVSQVSYIALGVAVVGPVATVGGLVHLVHQGIMKITLFFCAGNLAETLGIHDVDALDGVGRRMPWTMGAFTIAVFGMIGVPPLAGFVSKWYLGVGALEVGQGWVVAVLVASSVLNAMYFLPLVNAAWFKPARGPWDERRPARWAETDLLLLAPPLITAALVIGVGLFAAFPLSPLEWCRMIALRELTP